MDLTKNGVAFTLVSLLIATTILTITFIGDSTPADSYIDTLELRRDTTDGATSSLQRYFSYHVERVLNDNLATIGTAATGTGNLYDTTSLPASASAKTTLSNCFTHGTFTDPNNTQQPCYPLRNETTKLERFLDNYTQTDVDITTDHVEFTQSDAEHINVDMKITLRAEDFTAQTTTRIDESYNTTLLGTPDPLYRFEENPANRPYHPNISFTEPLKAMEGQALDRTIMRNDYFHWDQAPSFYQRLGNATSKNSSCCGLASIVRPQNVTNPNNYSHLDFQYWDNECGTNTKRVDFSGANQTTKLNYDYNVEIEAIEGVILPEALLNEAGVTDSTVLEDVNCTS